MTVKIEEWNPTLHGRATAIPSYGGWIRFRKIPLHMWSLATFRATGNCYGGFLDFADANSFLVDSMEAIIKVKGNYCGFILTEVKLEHNGQVFVATVGTYSRFLTGKAPDVHGSFSLMAAESFYKGSVENVLNPVDKWRIEDGYFYPTVKIVPISETEHCPIPADFC